MLERLFDLRDGQVLGMKIVLRRSLRFITNETRLLSQRYEFFVNDKPRMMLSESSQVWSLFSLQVLTKIEYERHRRR